VNPSYDGLWKCPHRDDRWICALAEGAGDVDSGNVAFVGSLQIGPGAEGIPGTGQNDDFGRISRRALDFFEEQLGCFVVDRVSAVGAVEGYALDAIIERNQQFVAHVTDPRDCGVGAREAALLSYNDPRFAMILNSGHLPLTA
jgi:hypothetical protein